MEQHIEIAGRRQSYFLLKNYCYDPSLSPPGKSVVGSGATTDWSYWEPLIGNPAAYDAEKAKIAALCREQIERRHPAGLLAITRTWKVTRMDEVLKAFTPAVAHFRKGYGSATDFAAREQAKP